MAQTERESRRGRGTFNDDLRSRLQPSSLTPLVEQRQRVLPKCQN